MDFVPRIPHCTFEPCLCRHILIRDGLYLTPSSITVREIYIYLSKHDDSAIFDTPNSPLTPSVGRYSGYTADLLTSLISTPSHFFLRYGIEYELSSRGKNVVFVQSYPGSRLQRIEIKMHLQSTSVTNPAILVLVLVLSSNQAFCSASLSLSANAKR